MKIATLSSLFHQSKKNWWYYHCHNYWGRRNLSFPTVTYAVTPQLDLREENIRIRRQLALPYRSISHVVVESIFFSQEKIGMGMYKNRVQNDRNIFEILVLLSLQGGNPAWENSQKLIDRIYNFEYFCSGILCS